MYWYNHKKDPKFKIGDSKYYKSIFAKGYILVTNWFEEVLKIKKKLKILRREHTLLMILMANKLVEYFTKNNSKKQIKKSLE